MVRSNIIILLLIFGFSMAKGQSNTQEWIEVNGIKWATRNINTPGTFVTNPSDLGMFYQWNRDVGWVWNGNNKRPLIPSEPDSTWKVPHVDTSNWNKGRGVCPEGWHLPTIAEIKSLIGSGSFLGTLNNEKGNFFIGDINIGDKSNNKLFFPFGTLDKDGDPQNSMGVYGNIWGNNNGKPCNMGYQDGAATLSNGNEGLGFYVRCVKNE